MAAPTVSFPKVDYFSPQPAEADRCYPMFVLRQLEFLKTSLWRMVYGAEKWDGISVAFHRSELSLAARALTATSLSVR